MVTIAEIARRASVSKTTVSRVLNGKPDVDHRTADRVQALVAELGYVRSASAQALAKGQARCIGLLVPSLTLPWLLEVLRGVADEVEAANYTLALHTMPRGDESLAAFSTQVSARSIDGLAVVVPGDLRDYLLGLRHSGLPVVVIDDCYYHPDFPSIRTTNLVGAYEATRHLLALDKTPVATITGPLTAPGTCDRLAGYRQALEEAGESPAPSLVVESDYTEPGGAAALDQLLVTRPQVRGVFAANDLMAFGAMRALARAGRAVPDDVAVVGFDDIPASAHTTPPLTTIRQPLYDMGANAARGLLAALNGRELPTEPLVLPTSLVIRGSCGGEGSSGEPPSHGD